MEKIKAPTRKEMFTTVSDFLVQYGADTLVGRISPPLGSSRLGVEHPTLLRGLNDLAPIDKRLQQTCKLLNRQFGFMVGVPIADSRSES